jgi:glutathione S-transferase
MKIYGHPMSTCARKVLTSLIETNTPYELVTIDFATGEHKKQPHLSRQPFGRVPTLDDDGFTMYESRAMCHYINDKAGGKLVPSDARARAVMEQWISIEYSYFSGPVMKFVFQHMFQRPQDPATLENAQKDLDVALPVMEAHLSKQDYFAGSDFSIADITYMPYVEYGMVTPVKDTFAKYASFMAWWNRVSERPSWRKVAGRG